MTSLPGRITAILKTGVEYKAAKMLARHLDPTTGSVIITDADGVEHVLAVGTDGKATLDGDPLSSGGGGINGPGAPTDVQLSNIGETSATVSWTPPGDFGTPEFDVYEVVITLPDGTFVGMDATDDNTATFFDVTGLTHDTDYVATVFALRNQDLAASARVSASFTSDAAPPKAPPTSPNYSGAPHAVTVTWTDPADWGNFQRVVARYSTSSYPASISSGSDGGHAEAGTQHLTISGLDPSSTYYVSLFASDDAETDVSDRATVTTTTSAQVLPAQVSSLSVFTDGSTSVTFIGDTNGQHGDTPPQSNGYVLFRINGAAPDGAVPTWDSSNGTATSPTGGVSFIGFCNYNSSQLVTDATTEAATQYTWMAWAVSFTDDLVASTPLTITHTTES